METIGKWVLGFSPGVILIQHLCKLWKEEVHCLISYKSVPPSVISIFISTCFGILSQPVDLTFHHSSIIFNLSLFFPAVISSSITFSCNLLSMPNFLTFYILLSSRNCGQAGCEHGLACQLQIFTTGRVCVRNSLSCFSVLAGLALEVTKFTFIFHQTVLWYCQQVGILNQQNRLFIVQ